MKSEDSTFQTATPSIPTTLMSKAFVFYFGRFCRLNLGQDTNFPRRGLSSICKLLYPRKLMKVVSFKLRLFYLRYSLRPPNQPESRVHKFRSPIRRGVKFSPKPSNTCGYSVWNLLYITFLVSRILRWAMGVLKLCVPFVKMKIYLSVSEIQHLFLNCWASSLISIRLNYSLMYPWLIPDF